MPRRNQRRGTGFLSLGGAPSGALVCAALLAAAALGGCRRAGPEDISAKKRGSAPGEKVPVVVEKVQKKSMPLGIEAIGAVEPLRSVAIKSIVTGSLWKVGFQEGSEVKKGDLLFEIDPRPFRIALSSAEADLQKTQAQLERAEED